MVSFSVKIISGTTSLPLEPTPGDGDMRTYCSPSLACCVLTMPSPTAPSDGLSPSGSRPQAHVLRNHTCGRTCSGAGAGPLFQAVTRNSSSSGSSASLAVSTKMSQYRSSSKTPVSMSWYSRSWRDRRALSSRRSW